MGLIYRKRKPTKRVTLSKTGKVTIKLGKGLSWRVG
jgi:hypothetical protein